MDISSIPQIEILLEDGRRIRGPEVTTLAFQAENEGAVPSGSTKKCSSGEQVILLDPHLEASESIEIPLE